MNTSWMNGEGDRVMQAEVHSRAVTGRDGQVYHVLTTIASGRGWRGRELYATEQPVVLKARLLREHDDNVELELDDTSLMVPVRRYAERPYVSRVTQQRNPHVDWNQKPQSLATTYSLSCGWRRSGWFRKKDVKLIG